jgi:thiol-disulfide isomerase/thioredoxin
MSRLRLILAVLGAVGALLAGCERTPPPPHTAARPTNVPVVPGPTSAPTEPVVLGQNDAALLQSLLTEEDDKAPVTEADKAWRALRLALQPPPMPTEWQAKEPSEEEVAKFEKFRAEQAWQAANKAKDFYTQYADHRRAGDARRQEFELVSFAADAGQTNALTRLRLLEAERLKDPNTSEDERLQIRVQQIHRARNLAGGDPTNALTGFEQSARALQKEFTNHLDLALMLLLSGAEEWVALDPARARPLAEEVVRTATEPELKDSAQALLKRLNLHGQPLHLKFKALDGREVDLEKLKGKVVLLDFWATWCGPCMMEVPNLRTAYEKLHPRGFEILGINFDADRAELERVLKQERMVWPQHFEEGGSHFGEEFGITSYPTMWLVDKRGVLRDLSARENLEPRVEKLLAEP